MAKIEKLILHNSDSEWGDEFVINQWHRDRGFRTVNVGGIEMNIGYNAVILNGRLRTSKEYIRSFDGQMCSGRYVDLDSEIEPDEGMAHALGHNQTTIGFCLIGKHRFTIRQLIRARLYVTERMRIHNLKISDIIGHYEVNDYKTCPNIDMDKFREYVEKKRLRPLKDIIWRT